MKARSLDAAFGRCARELVVELVAVVADGQRRLRAVEEAVVHVERRGVRRAADFFEAGFDGVQVRVDGVDRPGFVEFGVEGEFDAFAFAVGRAVVG